MARAMEIGRKGTTVDLLPIGALFGPFDMDTFWRELIATSRAAGMPEAPTNGAEEQGEMTEDEPQGIVKVSTST
jgi:hypothetical protein